MVTWGTNTVSVFNNANGNNSQTPAAAPGLFGSTATTSPGAPATPGFSGFSSQPNPISSPAPGLGLFSPVQPHQQAQQTQQQQQQYYAQAQAQAQASTILGAPQQAALQAHMNATAHQEASRLGSQLHQLYSAYTPFQSQPQAQNTTCRFQHIFYDPITQTQRLEKLSLPNYPPKPNHIPDATWYQALTQNPEPDEYIPVLVTSAEGLHSRLVAQQSKMKLHEGYLTKLDETLQKRESFHQSIEMQLEYYKVQNQKINKRLQQIMRKFEMCRGKNVPLQEAEREAVRRLIELSQHVNHVAKMLEVVKRDGEEYARQWSLLQKEKLRRNMGHGSGSGRELDEGVKDEAMGILDGYKKGIDEMVKVAKKGERDVKIMKNA